MAPAPEAQRRIERADEESRGRYHHFPRCVKAGCGRSPQVEVEVEVETGEKTREDQELRTINYEPPAREVLTVQG
jgi:hypothetical protein